MPSSVGAMVAFLYSCSVELSCMHEIWIGTQGRPWVPVAYVNFQFLIAPGRSAWPLHCRSKSVNFNTTTVLPILVYYMIFEMVIMKVVTVLYFEQLPHKKQLGGSIWKLENRMETWEPFGVFLSGVEHWNQWEALRTEFLQKPGCYG